MTAAPGAVEGFVLAGGRSTRMGRDKAALRFDGASLLEHVIGELDAVTDRVTVIAPPERYPGLGRLVLADRRQGQGPLAGIETALAASRSEWNVIVAVDMPGMTREFLGRLVARALASDADCVMSESAPGRLEPLCAAWRRQCLDAVERALDGGMRKVTDALGRLQVVHFPIDNQEDVVNINSPDDWRDFLERRRG